MLIVGVLWVNQWCERSGSKSKRIGEQSRGRRGKKRAVLELKERRSSVDVVWRRTTTDWWW